MKVKGLIFLASVLILISSCSTEDKTKPIITDAGGEPVKGESPVTGNVVKEPVENKTEAGLDTAAEEDNTEEIKDEEKADEELPPSTHVITIRDLKLEPRDLTIKKGDTVVWKHEDTWEKGEHTRHYLAAHTNEFRSPILFFGDTFNHTFNKEGTFTYIDIIYKERDYMRGEIIVE